MWFKPALLYSFNEKGVKASRRRFRPRDVRTAGVSSANPAFTAAWARVTSVLLTPRMLAMSPCTNICSSNPFKEFATSAWQRVCVRSDAPVLLPRTSANQCSIILSNRASFNSFLFVVFDPFDSSLSTSASASSRILSSSLLSAFSYFCNSCQKIDFAIAFLSAEHFAGSILRFFA